MQGGCACGEVRYRIKTEPMFTHCCHCTWCQRQTGSAFAVHALIETTEVEVLLGEPEDVPVASPSGAGQTIVRCPTCRTAVWSHYSGAGPLIAFLRAGTLDQPHNINPDIHIYTSAKRPWVELNDGKPVCEEYYDREKEWPAASLARRAALI